MTEQGPPKEIPCYRCGQPAELIGEKMAREAVGNVIFQAIATMTGQTWKWKYRCPQGHEESLDRADRRLDF